jgi:hypothetical protein
MLKIFNENYYIDLDVIQKMSTFESSDETMSGSSEQHISVVKYEMIKLMLDVVLSESEEVDEKLGMNSANSIPFKLAFNTLLNNHIINKY